MATLLLKNGERIYVDDDVLADIQNQSWSKCGKHDVKRSYRQGGKVRSERLLERIVGSPERGYVWGRRDDNWRNMQRITWCSFRVSARSLKE
ncbi:hypothetical protein D3875_22840 [Deinococcus cavernae]|uniref:Uncharacterized protein n=1 Tax=Deinococcus cavernae TaxID=2320857 RepID=A0A418UZ39_9DEIO|nr:hypothetical protein [Deinococcus cavernae]RJF68674.1 hypothetical protein D3875_22840 [Deinococcus cavernae]